IKELELNHIDYEIVLVNDNSTDKTLQILEELSLKYSNLKVVHSKYPRGFGRAIKQGLDYISADAVVIFMGDGSDDPKDVVRYYEKLKEGYPCVFGSRFMRGAKIRGYPFLKLIFNRLGNKLIQLLFLIPYNDISNAFKAYRREVIEAIQPLVSQYFNITVEIPLKAIIRGFSYAVIPINWYGRESGVSKYHIRELMRKYFFSILYVWLEKILLKEELEFRSKS
ncbi:MAG: glycosyltransferase family 2 protein, partial [Candidatus Omnitrophica bacterium]|nr:glycosyltransferase family 2 protein [Candidatus Omnitrophota bacterium]